MARKAIESVKVDEKKSAAKGKQEIKSLPAAFANDEHFRAYIALAALLISDNAADKANETLTQNKLLTVKQSVANYKANGITLEKEFYPVSVNVGGVFCGINRRQRVIFAAGFIGKRKIAFTISTRAMKALPELKGKTENYGYATKFLTKLDANNGTLLPASIDFNHFADNNFGLPFCYGTAKTDLIDYAQWLDNSRAYDTYKTLAADFESIIYDAEDCISQFCKVAAENGFEVFRQDFMKVAIDYRDYLQSVIDGDNFTAAQKDKAREILNGGEEKISAEKSASTKAKTTKAKATKAKATKAKAKVIEQIENQAQEIIADSGNDNFDENEEISAEQEKENQEFLDKLFSETQKTA